MAGNGNAAAAVNGKPYNIGYESYDVVVVGGVLCGVGAVCL
jgi:hypothetical protein